MITELINKMIEYETGCPQRTNHFLKVWAFAKQIAENENIDLKTKFIIESVAVIHDIGIKPSLEKYNSSAGHYQQIEGPAVARKILSESRFEIELIDRICFLIANHHTYDNIDGIDYQILIEADFLVNIFEDGLSKEKIILIKEKYFKTTSGKNLLDKLYLK